MTTIGYIVPEWPSQTHAFFWREVTALRELGEKVVLFSTREPPTDACRHAFADEARRTTHYLFPPRAAATAAILATRPRKVAGALAYIANLRETKPKERARLVGLLLCAADLVAHCEAHGIEHVHAHSCADVAHLVAMAERLGGPGYSLTLHGDLPVYGVDHAAKTAHARFVSAVTRPLRAQLLEATTLHEGQVPVITMGVDTDRFVPTPRTFEAGNALRILTVARLNPVKGHGYVLEAVARMRARGIDARYTIAGDGPHRAAIEAKVRELGLGAFVELTGTIGEADVLGLLHGSDCFVLASEGLGEAAPVSVMEAMAAGLPVVVSRIGGTPDMIRDGDDGILVEQKDVDALERALVSLATDPRSRKQFGERARERAVEAFDYRIVARQFRDEIRSAIARQEART